MVRRQVRWSVVLFLSRNRCRGIDSAVSAMVFRVNQRTVKFDLGFLFCWFGNLVQGLDFILDFFFWLIAELRFLWFAAGDSLV